MSRRGLGTTRSMSSKNEIRTLSVSLGSAFFCIVFIFRWALPHDGKDGHQHLMAHLRGLSQKSKEVSKKCPSLASLV